MIRSKKILLMITALTATTTFSNNCFAMENNKLIKPILVEFEDNIKYDSNNAKNNNILENENNKKMLEKKANNKSIQENKLESKIKNENIYKPENLNNNTNNNIIKIPQSNLDENYVKSNIVINISNDKNDIKLLKKKRNLKDTSKQNMLNLKKSIKVKKDSNINNNKNVNKNPSEYINLNNSKKQSLNEKLLLCKNELDEKINKLNITKNEIEKSRANDPMCIFNKPIHTYHKTLNDIKLFNNKFKNEIIDKSSEEYKESNNQELIDDILEILNDFEKTYSNFLKNDYKEIALDDVKNDVFNRLNKSTNTTTNENVLNNYNNKSDITKENFEENFNMKILKKELKEDFKDLVVMKIFKEELKKEYIKCIDPFLLKTINKTKKDYKEISVLMMPIEYINDEDEDSPKKYRIEVYFPTDFENFFKDNVNNSNKLYHYLISNERIIFGNAVINTVKKLREAGKLNICLYKNTSLIKNKTNPILENKDIDEAYHEINNITINTPCYKRLANFYDWLYMNTLGIRKEKGMSKTSIMYNILGKYLSNPTFETGDKKIIKIKDFVIDAKYDPNLEIYEKNTTTENINKENNEQHMKV